MHNHNEIILEKQTALYTNERVKEKCGFAAYLESFGENVFPYGNATHAFVDILFHLKLEDENSKPNIIMPSYIPAKLFRIIITAGYVPVFYEINAKCEFDINEIASLIDDNTKGIFVIHYFGHPANIQTLTNFANKKDIPLIEDCAHVLHGNLNNKKLGSFGDYAIFSVRKMLTLSDGGYLVINKADKNFKPSYTLRVNSLYTIPRFIQSRCKQIYFNLTKGYDLVRLARLPKRGFVDYGRAHKTNIKNISSFSSFYSYVADIDSHVRKRRENYNYLFEATKNISIFKPLYNNKPDLWTPYSFPVLVKENLRDEFQLELLDAGISCGTGWPESPFDKSFVQTKALANSLLEFPVHPLITQKQLDKIIDSCFKFEKRNGREGNKTPYYKMFLQIEEDESKIKLRNGNHHEDIYVKIISSDSGFDNIKDEWIALCEKSRTSIFQTYEWQRLWWKYFGKGSNLHLILFYKADELIGIAPLFIDLFSIWKINFLKRLRFLGSASVSRHDNSTPDYGVSDYLDIIILPGYEEAVAEKLIHYLKNNPGNFDIIELDVVSHDSNIFISIMPLLNKTKWQFKIIKREICPRILVLGTLADYMRSLSSKIRYQLTKIRRDRDNDSIYEVTKVQTVQELGREFDEFVKLHQQRWNAQGLPGAFVDNRFKNFLREISESFLNKGWLYLTSANSQGKCLAIEYAFKYKNNYYDYLKAFDDQSPYAKYRPGRALLFKLIEEAIEEKASVVDFLRGSEPYKFEIASEWHWVHKITIGNPVFRWRFRYNIFLIIFFISLLKHRIKKELHIARSQWINFGASGFASHYFPMTMKKLKNKYFTPDHISKNKIQVSENKPQENKSVKKNSVNKLRKKVL